MAYREWPHRLVLVGMLLFAVAAFGANSVLHRDMQPSLSTAVCGSRSSEQCTRLLLARARSEAAQWLKLRPLHTQVVAVRATDADPYAIEGEVIWRTLFGVPVARWDGGPCHCENLWVWPGTWFVFLGVEVLLGVLWLRLAGIWLP